MKIARFLLVVTWIGLGTGPALAVDLAKIDRTIRKEPAYQSKSPQYCLLVFGPKAETRVWLFDQELHREVALKEIRGEHANDPHSRGRFVREAEITGKLEHPGVVPVYGPVNSSPWAAPPAPALPPRPV